MLTPLKEEFSSHPPIEVLPINNFQEPLTPSSCQLVTGDPLAVDDGIQSMLGLDLGPPKLILIEHHLPASTESNRQTELILVKVINPMLCN
jgi:hypothetical protein